MFKVYRVSGDSLYPIFRDKELLLCKKIDLSSPLKPNDIVVFSKAPYGLMIKKITGIQDETFYVEGTTASSIDSRVFGFIQKNDILYKVLFRLGFPRFT